MTERNLPDAVRQSRIGTRAQWQAAGVPKPLLRALIRAGELVLVRPNVYASIAARDRAADSPRREHSLQVLAVRCVVGRDAVGSHQSAALIHGLDLLNAPPAGRITMTRPAGGRPAGTGVRFHTAQLPADQVTTVAGAPVTSVARTVVDLARSCSFMEGVVIADNALRRELTSKVQLRKVLTACARWPGSLRAGRVVDFSDGRAESVLESCARVFFQLHGLEPPELQTEICDGQGQFIGRVDFYWPQYQTVAESDGLSKYAKKADIYAQFRRDRLLHRAGRKVVHFTWNELFHETPTIITHIRHTFTTPPPPAI